MFGLRRRLRPGGRVCGNRFRGRVRHPGPSGCTRAQVPSRCRPVIWANPILDAGDHPAIRRRPPRRRRACRETRVRMRDTSPACEPTCRAVGQFRQREAFAWFTLELANLRAAFRWAADHDDLDIAAGIALYAFIGGLVEHYEPISWAEEIIEPARAVEHPRLAALYIVACQLLFLSAGSIVPLGTARSVNASSGTSASTSFLSTRCGSRQSVYNRRPARTLGRHGSASTRIHDDRHGHIRAVLAITLALSGSSDEAITLTDGLIETAESDATTRFHSRRRFLQSGWPIATSTLQPHLRPSSARWKSPGQRQPLHESHISVVLSDLEARHGSPEAAFDHLALAIRNYLETGNIATSRSPLAILAGSVVPTPSP